MNPLAFATGIAGTLTQVTIEPAPPGSLNPGITRCFVGFPGPQRAAAGSDRTPGARQPADPAARGTVLRSHARSADGISWVTVFDAATFRRARVAVITGWVGKSDPNKRIYYRREITFGPWNEPELVLSVLNRALREFADGDIMPTGLEILAGRRANDLVGKQRDQTTIDWCKPRQRLQARHLRVKRSRQIRTVLGPLWNRPRSLARPIGPAEIA
jgi:hypothetical protein